MNKNNIKISIFTFVIITIISLICVPKTQTKFIKEGSIDLAANIKELTGKGDAITDILPTSTPRRTHIEFTFSRNEKTLGITSKENPDKYTVEVNDKCIVLNMTSNNNNGNISVPNGTAIFTNSIKTDVTVTMHCEASYLKEAVEINDFVKIIEEIGEEPFPYMSFDLKVPLEKYPVAPIAKVNEYYVTEDTMPGDIKAAFKTWIEGNIEGLSARTQATEYIKYFVADDAPEERITNPELNKYLDGINIKYDDALKKYTFEMEENFEGFARTMYKSTNANTLYFSTTNPSEINDAFEIYLEKHVYVDKETDTEEIKAQNKLLREQVIRYVLANGGMSEFVLNPSKTIVGLTRLNGSIRVLSSLKDSAQSYVSFRELKLVHGLSSAMNTALRGSINAIDNSIISEDLKSNNFYLTIKDSALKNSTDSGVEKQAFTDYFITKDIDHYVLTKVYSDGTEEENHIEFDTLELIDGLSISIENTEDGEKIVRLEYTNDENISITEEQINEIITKLASYIPNLDVDNKTVNINEETGQITIEIMTKKQIEEEIPGDLNDETEESGEESGEVNTNEGNTANSDAPESPVAPEIPTENVNSDVIPSPNIISDANTIVM